MHRAAEAAAASVAGTRFELHGGVLRPPLERTEGECSAPRGLRCCGPRARSGWRRGAAHRRRQRREHDERSGHPDHRRPRAARRRIPHQGRAHRGLFSRTEGSSAGPLHRAAKRALREHAARGRGCSVSRPRGRLSSAGGRDSSHPCRPARGGPAGLDCPRVGPDRSRARSRSRARHEGGRGARRPERRRASGGPLARERRSGLRDRPARAGLRLRRERWGRARCGRRQASGRTSLGRS